MIKNAIVSILLIYLSAVSGVRVSAQDNQSITLQGRIYNSTTNKPVAAGTILILELKKLTNTDQNGVYRIDIPRPGTYTIFVKSEGLKPYKSRIVIGKNTTRNISLDPLSFKGSGLIITGRRDLQTVSRHTMSREQIKQIPSTFGDSMNALAALPGVVRAGGDLFGPIILRGGQQRGIRYLVDDIPIYSPMHYGGLHSVINSNLIHEIDLYSSAFPAEIGSATAGVISINTTDDVKKFGGYTDISIISATALIQTSLIKKEGDGIAIGSPLDTPPRDQKTAGYIIASGRSGYIDLIVLPLIQLITGQKIGIVPKYWDYQFKAKYFFNSSNSLTLFCMGSSDYLKFTRKNQFGNGSDPLLTGLQAKTDQQTHGQGLYYTYQPSEKFRNRLTFFSSLKQNYISVNFPMTGVSAALQGVYIDTRPYIFGATDKFKIVAVKNILEIRGGFEYTLYYFTARGKSFDTASRGFSSDISQDQYYPLLLNENIFNHGFGGYIETKINYGGLTIMPGFRTDYLKRSGEITWDPRFLISYEFETGTSISAAGGKYSNYFQTNPANFDSSPQLAKLGKSVKSEWAIHRVIGIEQSVKLFKIKAEGFYNEFFDLAQRYLHIGPDARVRQTMSSGKILAYGAELLLKLDKRDDVDGFFGWISYTYTRSRSRSGLPPYPNIYGIPYNKVADPWGHQWLNYGFEQNHSLKVILGYVLRKHTLTGKFQLYSSMPYTPIEWGQEDMAYAANNPGQHRYYPVFGRPNSRHFPINHRLDLRYSNTTTYSWGYVSWYIEVINVYNYRPIVTERWDYRFPYFGSKNPQRKSFTDQVAFIPNFGVEVKF